MIYKVNKNEKIRVQAEKERGFLKNYTILTFFANQFLKQKNF